MLESPLPTVSAVIITRNRIDMLRKTLLSVQASVAPVSQIVVTDDSSDDTTHRMLETEFPDVVWTKGPQRGMTANRNHGIRTAKGEYILLLDDDVIVDTHFVSSGLAQAVKFPKALFFPTMWEDSKTLLPNGLDLLGFSTKPYAGGEPYHTANCQCLLIPHEVAMKEPWDEVVSAYGYEEMEYAYRVSAAGYPLIALPECVCIHLAPNVNAGFRIGPDANRMYVTYKRHFYIDKRPARGLAFLAMALPHHMLARVKRNGVKGVGEAWANFSLAARLLRRHKRAQV